MNFLLELSPAMTIILPIIIVTAVGVLASVLLSLASKYMSVKTDERVAHLRECMPGANCGACGFTGCDGYAAALAEGNVKANLCVPGGVTTANGISEILGVSAEGVESRVAFVHCNGNTEATSKLAEFDKAKTCKGQCLLYGGGEACVYSCLGCGDCADVCPVNAICVKDGVARIDSRTCIGCGMCVETCPKHIISLLGRKAKVAVMCSSHDSGAVVNKICKNGCIACRKCEKTCPNGAITVVNNLAVIDYEKCTACGACVEVCPKHCIKSVDFAENSIK